MKILLFIFFFIFLCSCSNAPVVQELGNDTYAVTAYPVPNEKRGEELALYKANSYCESIEKNISVKDVHTNGESITYKSYYDGLNRTEVKRTNLTFSCQ